MKRASYILTIPHHITSFIHAIDIHIHIYTIYLRHPVSGRVHHAQVEERVGETQVSRHLSYRHIGIRNRSRDIWDMINNKYRHIIIAWKPTIHMHTLYNS